MSSATVRFSDTQQAKSLTDVLQTKLQNPATSPEFDFQGAVEQVLADVGLTAKDSEGGSYRVVVSLTRTVLWLLSMGIFDKAYAKATAGSTDAHTTTAPVLFPG